MKIAVLILAAGGASRMKTCKQLLKFENLTLLETALSHAITSNANDVFCVLGAYADRIQQHIDFDNIDIIFNKNWHEGLSSSIVAGVKQLHTMSFDTILITLADQPFVDTTYLNTLLTESASNPNAIIASNYGTKFGVPAVFPQKYFDTLLKLKGDRGAKALLNSKNSPVKTVVSKGNLFDVDTLEDYNRL